MHVADALGKIEAYEGRRLMKLDFLFGIMSVQGLKDSMPGPCGKINHLLKLVFHEEKKENLDDLVRKIFSFLKKKHVAWRIQRRRYGLHCDDGPGSIRPNCAIRWWIPSLKN